MKFIDRKEELKLLNKHRYKGLGVIYGRRRVGKTTLLRKAFEDIDHIYYQAVRLPADIIYREMAKIVGEHLGDPALKSGGVSSIEIILKSLNKSGRRTNLIIDEAGYIMESDPSFTSVMQRFIDKGKRTFGIFLSGSTISIMEREMGEKSPLWGRLDFTLEVPPLKFSHLKEYWDNIPFRQLASYYGCLGGIPYHWEKVKPKSNFFSSIKEAFLTPGAPLYQEIPFLLKEELRETQKYMVVLQAISEGRRRFSKISDFSGIPVQSLSKYLGVLQELRWIKQTLPVGTSRGIRGGLWYINDPLFRFWFKFIMPNRHLIEENISDEVIERIKQQWDTFMGEVYEKIALEITLSLIKKKKMPFVREIGKWWDSSTEMDILGINTGKEWSIAGEVKWGKFTQKDFNNFMMKLNSLPIKRAKDAKILLFSGKGFDLRYDRDILYIKGDKPLKAKYT